MTTRSIFQKVCPSCMATVALDAKQCACGHDFEQENADPLLSSEEIRLKAEELYESYLAARAEQATKAVKAAQAEFARDPVNIEKSERVDGAIREAQTAQAALAAQSARIAEMKKALQPAAPEAPAPIPAPVIPISRKPAAPRAAPARASASIAGASKKRTAAVHKPVIAHPARAARKASAPVAVARPNAKHPAPVIAALTAPKNSPAPAPTPAPRKLPVAPTAQSLQTATPNDAFRQVQAAKAEKILRAALNAPSAIAKKETPSEMPAIKPAAVPTTPAPTKTAPRLLALPNGKECPNCTAAVAGDAARCRCGYEFPSSEQLIPPLAMSEEERAEFAKLFVQP